MGDIIKEIVIPSKARDLLLRVPPNSRFLAPKAGASE